MNPVAKLLIGTGVLLIVCGLLWQWGGRLFPLGRLPGDIAIERENFRFYFPLTTSIILSAIFSALMYLFHRFGK